MPTAFQPVDTPPDSALIARFQSGDSGVFDLLYLRHRNRIHGVVLSMISNPDDALDITQEVFLKGIIYESNITSKIRVSSLLLFCHLALYQITL